jgi:CDP-diacylglycerol--glycerol-3-phosphate 3-phosphatidyltransferase
MFFNLPTSLTWIRILAVPLVVFSAYLLPASWTEQERGLFVALAFAIASLTDLLDGFLARKMKQETAFGAFLDPVADKLLVCAALLVLLDQQRVALWIALLIIGREISVSALREWMAQLGSSRQMAVHWVGKVKTVAQMIAIPFLLYKETSSIGTVLIHLAAILTLLSMFYYCLSAYQTIKSRRGRSGHFGHQRDHRRYHKNHHYTQRQSNHRPRSSEGQEDSEQTERQHTGHRHRYHRRGRRPSNQTQESREHSTQ